jgi:hypothetical protein
MQRPMTPKYLLYWKDQQLGTVRACEGEFPWMSGDFSPTAIDRPFRELFKFMADDDAGEPPFGEELLEEGNWWMVGFDGQRRGITVPAVWLDEGHIAWRWR